MRLSSLQIYQQGISAILNQQTKVQNTQQQLSTGLRIQKPSDDPVGTVQILDLTEDLARIDQYQRNADMAYGRLAQEESTIGAVNTTLQRVRELVVQAGNASQTPETHQSIAAELNARLDELVALANTQDATGEYIFSGFQSGNKPFAKQGATVTYSGDSGQRFVQIASGTQIAVGDPGEKLFLSIPEGDGTMKIEHNTANTGTAIAGAFAQGGGFVADTYTVTFSQATPSDPVTYQVVNSSLAVVGSGIYTNGDAVAFGASELGFSGTPANGDVFTLSPAGKESLFDRVQTMVTALQNSSADPAGRAQLNNVLSRGLESMDQAIGHLSNIRSEVGVRMAQIDSQTEINESFSLQLEESLSSVRDLDYAEAISRLNLELTALQAAQQTYVKVQGLSLFNYIN